MINLFKKSKSRDSIYKEVTRENDRCVFNDSIHGHDILVGDFIYRNVTSIYAKNEGFWYLAVVFKNYTYVDNLGLKKDSYDYDSGELTNKFLKKVKYLGESPKIVEPREKDIRFIWANGKKDYANVPKDLELIIRLFHKDNDTNNDTNKNNKEEHEHEYEYE